MSHWIVIPVFNEAAVVGTVAVAARRHGPVIVVDDGSTDGSAEAAREAGALVLRHDRRCGKGAALRTGIAAALAQGAHAIVTLDGDGQHDPEEIPRLMEAARAAPRAVVVGGRLHGRGAIPPGRMNALRVAGFFIDWLTETDLRDTQSGFRVYPATLFREVRLHREGFVLETEALLTARRTGYGLREVPVTAIYRADRRSRFRPVRDGCAVGAFLARNVLARLGAEAWHILRRLGAVFSPPVARRRHADLARETAAYRSSPAEWGIAVGAFTLRRMAGAVQAGWREPRVARLRMLCAGAAASPLLALLALLHPAAVRCSLDLLTPFVRRLYCQDRLARAGRSELPRPTAPPEADALEDEAQVGAGVRDRTT